MKRIKKELRDEITVIPSDAEKAFEATFSLTSDFIGFQGHFDDRPIMPGVAVLEAALVAGEKALGENLKMTEIKSAKFFRPLAPDMTVKMLINIEKSHNLLSIKATVHADERKISGISIMAESDRQ